MTTKYNGWTNYETWLINLHITDEQWILDECIESTDLKDTIEELLLDMSGTSVLACDLIGSALSQVNWKEIEKSLKELSQ